MSKHIPTCGCQVIHEYDWIHKEREHVINYCLLHTAAPDLLALVKTLTTIATACYRETPPGPRKQKLFDLVEQADDLITHIEGV